MRAKELERIILKRDIPEFGLRRGDIGTVVYVHDPEGYEVEFMLATGDTVAVVGLGEADVRRPSPKDMLSARPRPPHTEVYIA